MSEEPTSYRAVVTALLANTAITIAKFVAFFLSGSGAMLSEAIHTLADTGNQFLLFLGMKRASREKSPEFHYGYGAERFVFGILSASGIFFVGCGVTVYHGITGMLHPKAPDVGPVTAGVLLVSLLLEGYSMSVAVRSIWHKKRDRGFFEYLLHDADPAALAIVFEDGAALFGLVLAALGIAIAYVTHNAFWDALFSTLIGLLLGFVAVVLVAENRELLLGKAAPPDVEEHFRSIVLGTAGIRRVHDIKTRQLTPETYTFKAEITLDEGFVEAALAEVFPPVGATLSSADRARYLRVLSTRAVLCVSDLIDDVEDRVKAQIPEARHVDLEVDHTDEKAQRSNLDEPASTTAGDSSGSRPTQTCDEAAPR